MRLHTLKWVLAASLIAGGVKAYQSRESFAHWVRRHQFQAGGLAQAVPSRVYFLETNRWLDFDFPHETTMARLISNASVSSSNQAPSGTLWPYAIEYQVCASQGRILATGVYHFKGRQLLYVDHYSGKPASVNSYLDREISPLNGRRWMLNLKENSAITNAQSLRLRLHSAHSDLLEVAVRVYFQYQVPERKLAYRWNRLSDDQKRDLARGNVYSFEGLTTQEKQGLLRFHWLVAAPEGIPGRDFRRRTIYIRDDSESLKILRDWAPAGIALDSGHRGVLPITNAPGDCHIQLVDYSAASTTQAVSSSLLWHGTPRQFPQTNLLTWSRVSPRLVHPARDGWLEISASRPACARAFYVDHGQTNEITPEPANILAFVLAPSNPLEFAVNHAAREPVLFRIDVRRAFDASSISAPPNSSVRCEFLADHGGVLHADNITLTNTLSTYDWLVKSNGLGPVSDPQPVCFVLPLAVRTLRVVSPADSLLVNAYSRPVHLPKRVEIPADYSPVGRISPQQPSWFSLRPPDYFQRRDSGQTAWVRVQVRPPDCNPLILTGQYEWDSFLPGSNRSGRMILLPAQEGAGQRTSSLPFSYSPVPVGSEQRLRFKGSDWERQVAPSLILVATNGPASVQVSVDGRIILNQRVESAVASIRLGNFTVGDHALTISSSSAVSAFVNFLESGTHAPYIQRFCISASSGPQRFPYVKREPGAEALVLRVFSPLAASTQPFKVSLKLKPSATAGSGPFSEITFLEREAWVTPGLSGRTLLVAAETAQLDDGQPVFFPVGSDVPPGEHEIEVTISAASPRWLSLSRTSPGLAEKLEITSDRALF